MSVSDKLGTPVLFSGTDEPPFTGMYQTIKRDSDGYYWIYTESGWKPLVQMLVESDFLSGDVTMTNANEFYEGPVVEVIEGTWAAWGSVTVASPDNTAMRVTAKLISFDDTVLSSAEATAPAMGASTKGLVVIPLFGIKQSAVESSFRIEVASSVAGCLIKAAPPDNAATAPAAGNTASYIYANRIVPAV